MLWTIFVNVVIGDAVGPEVLPDQVTIVMTLRPRHFRRLTT